MFNNMYYLEEEKRGFYPEENLAVPGRYEVEINENEEKEIEFIYFTLSTVSQSEIVIDLTEQGITVAFGMPFSKEMNIKGTLSIG